MKVLLAEDDPCEAKLTLSALRASNLSNEILVVCDGEEALDYLYRRGIFEGRERGNPDTIVLDLKMPKVSGLEALAVIKRDANLKMIPVIMLTSSCEAEDLKESYKQGVNAYVVKPIDYGEFARVVEQIALFWTAINRPPPDLEVLQQGC